MTTPAPFIPFRTAALLNLFPLRSARLPNPESCQLIGFWRNTQDINDPRAARSYKSAMARDQEVLDNVRQGKPPGCYSGSTDPDQQHNPVAFWERQVAASQARLDAYLTLPWPGDHLGLDDPEERERLATLLDRAPVVATYRGTSFDRLNPTDRTNGNGERALGGYIWPTGLSHYVRIYGLLLPAELIHTLNEQS